MLALPLTTSGSGYSQPRSLRNSTPEAKATLPAGRSNRAPEMVPLKPCWLLPPEPRWVNRM